MEILTLTKRTGKGNFFESNENKYWLRPVDRDYPGRAKKPEYYLSKIIGKETKFISGFFPTKNENVFSYDVKNQIGMKQFMIAQFLDAGKKIILRKK